VPGSQECFVACFFWVQAEDMGKIEQRRTDLDIARAVAVFLVLVFHITQYFGKCGFDFPGPVLTSFLLCSLGSIHIPVFMLVAGTVLALSGRQVGTPKEYGSFVRGKVLRIMLPYVSITVLHLPIMILTPDKGLDRAAVVTLNMLIEPMAGPAGHLWFLYALMSMFLVWPFFAKVRSRKVQFGLFLGMIALAIFSPPLLAYWELRPLFGFHEFRWFLPMFFFGYWYGGYAIRREGGGIALILIVGSVWAVSVAALVWVQWPTGFAWVITRRMVAWLGYLTGGLFVIWLCNVVDRWRSPIRAHLLMVGQRAYDVYLLHAVLAQSLVFLLSKLEPSTLVSGVVFCALPFIVLCVTLGIGQLIRCWPRAGFVVLGDVPRK